MMIRVHFTRLRCVASLGLLTACLGGLPLQAADNHGREPEDSLEIRARAGQRVGWQAPGASTARLVPVKILAINDFHGQITAGRTVGGRPVGSAAVLASYLRQAREALPEDQSFIVHAGDHVGVSPVASALLADEPSISFMNILANDHCRFHETQDPHCNMIGALGNHEFDKGRAELLRLIYGGNHPDGPFLDDPYEGARFPYVAANVVDVRTGETILPPFVIREVQGVRVAFIGIVLKDTPTIVSPGAVAGLRFLDEAETVNRYVHELKAHNVRSIVALIHQGGQQASQTVTGPIAGIVSRLDDEVDVVVSGHTHNFTNALLPGRNGAPILVVQAFASGTSYADIDLMLDPATKDVVAKSAAIVSTFADAGPGLTPDPEVADLVRRAEIAVGPLVNRVIGDAVFAMSRVASRAGESAVGNLVADAQRVIGGSDVGFTNQGGLRADIAAGPVTWAEAFAVQPFNNTLVTMTLTGQQLYDALNQQWINQPFPRILQVSGLTYTWDGNLPIGNRIVEIRHDEIPIDRFASYSVTVNSFLAAGGDNFPIFRLGTDRVVGPLDVDALVLSIESLTQPFGMTIQGRIQRLD
jgi:5'-nucleotidase